MSEKVDQAVLAVKDEALGASRKYPPFRSYHEGYAIIKEELEELWEEVKKKPSARDHTKIRNEAKQVAAMAVRFMADLSEYNGN